MMQPRVFSVSGRRDGVAMASRWRRDSENEHPCATLSVSQDAELGLEALLCKLARIYLRWVG